MTNRKYVPLNQYLDSRERAEAWVTLSFAEIEHILGFPLPPTAMLPSYWTHGLVARNWFLGGYAARLDRHTRSVTFHRVQSGVEGTGRRAR